MPEIHVTIEIAPGYALDFAVAKALELGAELSWSGDKRICVIDRKHFPDRVYYRLLHFAVVEFRPSTDLKDAFWAADKCDLWKRYPILSRLLKAGERDAGVLVREDVWAVYAGNCGGDAGFGPTPALAICAAIMTFLGQDEPKPAAAKPDEVEKPPEWPHGHPGVNVLMNLYRDLEQHVLDLAETLMLPNKQTWTDENCAHLRARRWWESKRPQTQKPAGTCPKCGSAHVAIVKSCSDKTNGRIQCYVCGQLSEVP